MPNFEDTVSKVLGAYGNTMGGMGSWAGVLPMGKTYKGFSSTQPTTQKASPEMIKKVAALAGIPPEAVQIYIDAMNSSDPGLADLAGTGVANLMDGSGNGSGSGGGGGGSSFQMGVDPAGAWNAEMGYKRSVDIMNAIGELVSAEVSRRATSVDAGAKLLDMYQQAVGISAPSGMKDIPGFEEGGLASDLASRLGISMPQGGQNAERAKIPFSSLAANVNKLNTPIESDIERFRALIQELIPEVPQLSNMNVAGSMSGAGGGAYAQDIDWASLMEPEPEQSGVSEAVRKIINNNAGQPAKVHLRPQDPGFPSAKPQRPGLHTNVPAAGDINWKSPEVQKIVNQIRNEPGGLRYYTGARLTMEVKKRLAKLKGGYETKKIEETG